MKDPDIHEIESALGNDQYELTAGVKYLKLMDEVREKGGIKTDPRLHKIGHTSLNKDGKIYILWN